jgi:hypothetical protein
MVPSFNFIDLAVEFGIIGIIGVLVDPEDVGGDGGAGGACSNKYLFSNLRFDS